MKHSPKKPGRSASSKLAITATMLAVPMTMAPRPGLAQATGKQASASQTSEPGLRFVDLYLKGHEQYSITGVDEGRTIYQNSRGEYFYIDSATGDMKFLPAGMASKWITITIKGQAARSWPVKMNYKVTIVGIDRQGHVVQKNSRGEKFYVDAAGNIVYVK